MASCSCFFETSLSFDYVTHHSNYYCTLPSTRKVIPSRRAGDIEITQVGYFLVKKLPVPMCLRFIPFHSDFLSLINLFIYLLEFLGAGFEIEPLWLLMLQNWTWYNFLIYFNKTYQYFLIKLSWYYTMKSKNELTNIKLVFIDQ